MKMYRIIFLLLGFVVACDSGDSSEPEEDLVTVRYALSSDNNGRATILFIDEHGEFSGGNPIPGTGSITLGDGWEYEFNVEEGTQLLYLMTSKVVRGSVEAQIFVDDKLVASHMHASPNTTATQRIASSAWGKNDDIKLLYEVDGAFIDDITLELTSGTMNTTPADLGHNNYCRFGREMTTDVGFLASVGLSRRAADFPTCVSASIKYEPREGLDYPLVLAETEQCDVSPFDLAIEVRVPGF